MSIGKVAGVLCTHNCAWYDTAENECAVSRINGNLKCLEDLKALPNAIDSICNEIGNLSNR